MELIKNLSVEGQLNFLFFFKGIIIKEEEKNIKYIFLANLKCQGTGVVMCIPKVYMYVFD
jgi:hypothetical protein